MILSLTQSESNLKVFSVYNYKLDNKDFTVLEFLLEIIALNQLFIIKKYLQSNTLELRVARFILISQISKNLDTSECNFSCLNYSEDFTLNAL